MTVMSKIDGTAFRPASRIAAIGVSKILQIGARASAMKRDGLPVIILGAGEPDFDTPDNIKQAAKAAIDRGETKYTALDGAPELKQAIAEKFRRENGVDYALDEITVATGAKQILFNAFMASLDPGDEVIIPTPYWTSYSDIVEVCGGVPVLIPCSAGAGFRLKADQLEEAITPKTRWVLFNLECTPAAGQDISWISPHDRRAFEGEGPCDATDGTASSSSERSPRPTWTGRRCTAWPSSMTSTAA